MEIKRITRRQPRATAAQRLQMVEQFRRSGLTRAAFSRQHQVPLATLNWWLAKTKRASNLPAPFLFNEVILAPLAATPTNPWAMEVVTPSGLTVRCREALALQELSRLLRVARC